MHFRGARPSKVRRARADAVIFMPAKFCEPALFDYVLMKQGLEKAGVPQLVPAAERALGVEAGQIDVRRETGGAIDRTTLCAPSAPTRPECA